MPETGHRTGPASIACSDGVALVGQQVLPPIDKSSVTKVIASHPAIGVDMSLYRGFATYLAEHGQPTFIYGLRDTGESVTGDAERDRAARMGDWIFHDVPAVTVALKEKFPNAKRITTGHSIGIHDMLAT